MLSVSLDERCACRRSRIFCGKVEKFRVPKERSSNEVLLKRSAPSAVRPAPRTPLPPPLPYRFIHGNGSRRRGVERVYRTLLGNG